jgi:hypothetical protein
VKPRLGDDESDGWLLLGGPGAGSGGGSTLSPGAGGGSSLSAHETLSAATASSALSSGGSATGGTGPVGRGVGWTPPRVK